MAELKYTFWGRQIDSIAHELSRLAIVCDIELGRPGLAERILKNDERVYGKKNPKVFQQMRKYLMALFSLEEQAVERLGPEDTREILDQVRAAIVTLRQAGNAMQSLPKEIL